MKQQSPNVPSRNLMKLAGKLFREEPERARFLEALQGGDEEKSAVLWLKSRSEIPTVPAEPWQPSFVDVVAQDFRAGADPRHDDGEYYCLDLSSVFAASVVNAISPPPETILDLCSSPGGKAIFAWRAFSPRLLVCNEVIGKRTGQLIGNLNRCGIAAYATSADVGVLAEKAAAAFDLVIVDTPCSGQSLVARGRKAPACFHPSTINQNVNRQRRIVANAAQTVAPGGHLAYMTCTYSPEENEGIIEWLLEKFAHFTPVEAPHLTPFRSWLSETPCYRLSPQLHVGAGAFTALLRNDGDGDRAQFSVESLWGRWTGTG